MHCNQQQHSLLLILLLCLWQFIDAVALPPDLINNVCEADVRYSPCTRHTYTARNSYPMPWQVDEAYLEFIVALNKKMSCLKVCRLPSAAAVVVSGVIVSSSKRSSSAAPKEAAKEAVVQQQKKQ